MAYLYSPTSVFSPYGVVSPYAVHTPIPAMVNPTTNPIPSVHSQPFVPSVDLTYSRHLLSMVENLNADPQIHKQLTKYFYYKVLDKWIYDDLLSLLSMLTINDDTVSLVKKLDDVKTNTVLKNSQEEIDKKIDFLEDNILTKEMVQKILYKFVSDTNINWYDLTKYEGAVREVIGKTLKSKMRRMIADEEFGMKKDKSKSKSKSKSKRHDDSDSDKSDD